MTTDVIEPLLSCKHLTGFSLHQWQTFTSENQWNDFSIRVFHFPKMSLPPMMSSRYTLLFNAGWPLYFYNETGDQWKKYTAEKGTVLRLSVPGEMNALRWENDFKAIQLTIEPKLLDEIADEDGFCLEEKLNLSDPFLADNFSHLLSIISDTDISERLYLESLVLGICIHLITNYPSTGKKIFAPKGKLSASQLSRVADFTHTNINRNISLAEMASCANLSSFHFARLFRQTTGVSPYQFVLQMKIEYSKKLILQNSGSISDVAYVLNFTDQAHFSNAFKKVTGVSPRQFLQNNEV